MTIKLQFDIEIKKKCIAGTKLVNTVVSYQILDNSDQNFPEVDFLNQQEIEKMKVNIEYWAHEALSRNINESVKEKGGPNRENPFEEKSQEELYKIRKKMRRNNIKAMESFLKFNERIVNGE